MNFDQMTGSQLVEEYNRMAAARGLPPVRKFESKAVAVRRCQALASRPQVAAPSPSKHRGRVIRLKVDQNPRRPGTHAHRHFEAMVGSPTVGEYLAKFTDQRTAAQWLWNTIRDGYAELLG